MIIKKYWNKYQIKKVSQNKEIKTRIKSEKWNISDEIMTNQIKIIEDLNDISLCKINTKEQELFIG